MDRYRFLLLAVPLLLLCACFPKRPTVEVTRLKAEPYAVHNIMLRANQVKPIEYLLKNPDQKGLIIAHYLGTGKTFTSLAFAERFPQNPVIIIAPYYLETNWKSEIRKMGIPNVKRYEFYSYERASRELLNVDLSSTILILDEVHRLVAEAKSQEDEKRQRYTKLYENLKTSQRRLLLTGTLIFNELSDFSYAINLAAGADILPYNERLFLDQFTIVEKGKSFWRGHVTESVLLMFGLPFVLAGIPLAFLSPSMAVIGPVYFGAMIGGFSILPIINASAPLKRVALRSFSAENLGDLSSQYVSYYQFDKLDPNFPSAEIKECAVDYSALQSKFFLNFADLSLSNDELSRMARESAYKVSGNTAVESSAIQTKLSNVSDSGREIGNFHFLDHDVMIESPKFLDVLKTMGTDPKGIVVYSNYLENGILLFAEFLDRHGLKGKYELLQPTQTEQQQLAILEAYNSGNLPILLLHPIFTEGISLKGTRQLHILEPIPSQAMFEQVIGRTVRFASHAHLPPKERHVQVYAWTATFSGYSSTLARNDNWGKRFNELNSIASFGSGLAQIDPNFMRKQMAPDEFAEKKREILKKGSDALKSLFREFSIERHIETVE